MTTSFALHFLWREWRSGELRLLVWALVIAVAASSAVGFFAERVEKALTEGARTFLGADLVLESGHAVPDDWLQAAREQGLESGQQRLFSSMLMRDERMLLVSIKAVDAAYPLKGRLRVAPALDQPAQGFERPPARGQIWLEPRILEALGVSPGDHTQVGRSQLEIAGVLMHEPDRGGGWLSLRPRALMRLEDLPETELIGPGSRVRYRYLFNGEREALASYRDQVQPQLRPGQRLLNLEEESPALGETLTRARRYLSLSGLLAVALAAVAIAMAARRYSERHLDTAALLRCLGTSRPQLLRLFLLQMLVVSLGGAAGGLLLGWLAQEGLVWLVRDYLPQSLPASGWRPALTAALTGLLVLAAAVMPRILQLARVAPLRVLRRELSPLPPSRLVLMGVSAALAILLLWWYSRDLPLALLLGGAGTLGALVVALLGWGLIKLLARLPGGLAWRLGVRNLLSHPGASLSQLSAFTLTLGAMALLVLVRTQLLADWEQQLPEDAPNYFLVNIQPDEVDSLSRYLDQHSITHSTLYPMVRGRLSHLNGQPARQQLAPDSPGRRAIRRDLNLSWSAGLPPGNRIQAGRWWQSEDQGRPLVSVETGLAQDLQLELGDRLEFQVAERSIEVEVASLRSLNWSSLKPNFYMLFPPETLKGFPATYVTSFYLPENRSSALNELMQNFPSLSLLEVDALLDNLRNIISRVTLAVEYLLGFVLAAGVLVLLAGLANSQDERRRETVLLRTLGAHSRLLKAVHHSELGVLGACAGLLAAALVQVVVWRLYQLLQMEGAFSLMLWLGTPLAGMLLVMGFGHLGTRKMLQQRPLAALRNL